MIHSVALRNFKCFQDAKIPFGPLTLLSGINSAGKSTTIQSLLVLRQSWLAAFQEVVLNGGLVNLGNANDVLSEDANEDLVQIEVQGDGGSLQFDFELKGSDETFQIRHRPQPGEPHLGLFGSCFQYLRAERLGPRTMSALSNEHVLRHREIGASGEYTAHFLSAYGSDQVAHQALLHPDAQSKALLAQAEAWLGEISPGVQISVTEYRQMDLVNLSFSFAVAGVVRSDPYRPANVGFGLTYALPIIVAALAARDGDILIIENPEAHLHPRAQARIGRFLALAAQEGIQILIETHSDHVLNGIRLAAKHKELDPEKVKINFFSRPASGPNRPEIVTPVLDGDGRLSIWPRGFFDEWENSLDQLLD